jgi:hypothetical protein
MLAKPQSTRTQPFITFLVAHSNASPVVALQDHERPRERKTWRFGSTMKQVAGKFQQRISTNRTGFLSEV